MKKIFLTSGLILCMACPAMADLQSGDINTTGQTPVLQGENGPTQTAADCSYPTLQSYTGPVAFEPVWEAAQYTVTYNAGLHPSTTYTNNILHTDTDGATYNTAYSIPSAVTTATSAEGFAADGYTFAGWTTDSEPSFVSGVLQNQFTGYTAQNPWNRESDLTVYAAYQANGYKITFSCGTIPDGASTDHFKTSTGRADVDVVFGRTYNAIANATTSECELEGYHFTGWTCENNISTAGGTYNFAGDTECVAQWAANPINLIWYTSNDSSNTAAIDTTSGTDAAAAGCTYDGGITLPDTEPGKGGYVFKGWRVTPVRATVSEP